jgi:hypothetical protein
MYVFVCGVVGRWLKVGGQEAGQDGCEGVCKKRSNKPFRLCQFWIGFNADDYGSDECVYVKNLCLRESGSRARGVCDEKRKLEILF